MAQDYVRRVNEGFDDADEAGRKLLTIARDTGVLLHKWKDAIIRALGHGNWIEAYEMSGFKKSLDTAQTWMRLAPLTDVQVAEVPSIRQALLMLRGKKQKKAKLPPPEPAFSPDDIMAPPSITVTEVEPEPPPALPAPPEDQNTPLRELDALMGSAYELMQKHGIPKMLRVEDDDTQIWISSKPPPRPRGRPKKQDKNAL